MSIPHALLGLLARAPMHGYELKSAFEAEFASLLTLNYGQLYPALDRLESDGLVLKERVEQDDRPDKKVYSITPRGWAELSKWLGEPSPPPKLNRDEFTFKLMAVGTLSMAEAHSLVQRQRQVCLQTVGEWTRGKSALNLKREPVAFLLAESAILKLEADLKWLDRVEELLPVLAGRLEQGGA